MLAVELWGLGDIALAVPFLREAAKHGRVTLLAKPHAAPLLRRFAPETELIELNAPWTAFRGKYRLHRWPWRELRGAARALRTQTFTHAVSARRDPREHAFLRWAGIKTLCGFPRAGSGLFLHEALPLPSEPHRAAHWRALATSLGWTLPPAPTTQPTGRHLVMHIGAAQPTRRWPRERYESLAQRLRDTGWRVTLLDDSLTDLNVLLDTLATADRFVGGDSGPGHLAALLGMPTFTLFGPQLPELFAPQHAHAAWIEGAPCDYKPCFDNCRYAQPNCLLHHTPDNVWPRLAAWLSVA